MDTADTRRPTLYYDGGCPVCAGEIAMYRRQPGADDVKWVDVARCAPTELGADLDRDAAMQRLHLRRADGTLVSGAAAFAELWRNLPRWAWLGRLFGNRPGLWLMERGYRAFLVVRRMWRRTP